MTMDGRSFSSELVRQKNIIKIRFLHLIAYCSRSYFVYIIIYNYYVVHVQCILCISSYECI